MKRRGFLHLLAGFLLLPFRQVAHAVCNPSLVRLLDKGQATILHDSALVLLNRELNLVLSEVL